MDSQKGDGRNALNSSKNCLIAQTIRKKSLSLALHQRIERIFLQAKKALGAQEKEKHNVWYQLSPEGSFIAL